MLLCAIHFIAIFQKAPHKHKTAGPINSDRPFRFPEGFAFLYCCGALPVVSGVDALESAETAPGVIELPTFTSRVR